jgi:predicted ribosome quality control (RQC) complex YloA/Tae2 family protein
MYDSIWLRKGATLSDKSARKEFGLTQDDIIRAIRQGKLQFRENNVFGNPYLRLLRHEVEALVKAKHGRGQLERKKVENELARVTKELKKLRAQIRSLEKQQENLRRVLGR